MRARRRGRRRGGWTMLLDLPVGLLNDLADWQEQFDTNFRHDTGWISDAVATDWADRADQLAAALRDALPATVALHVNLWPVATRRRWLARRRR